jgi:hypothetical protein
MAAGDPVFGSDFDAVLSAVGIRKVKDSSQIRTSTTTLLDDGEINGIELTPGRYHVKSIWTMYGGTAGIPIVTRWGFTGTWNNPLRIVRGPTAANTTAANANPPQQRTAVAAGSDVTYGLGTSAFYQVAYEESMQVSVTATGMFSLMWRPNSSSANSGGVNQGTGVIIVPFEQ